MEQKILERQAQFKEQLAELQGNPAAVEAAPATRDLLQEKGLVEEVHSEQDLDDYLKHSSGLVVLEVVSSWCRTCKSFGPKYKRLAGSYEEIKFLKMTRNENESTDKVTKERYNIKATPSFLFLRNGREVARQTGANLDDLHSILDTA
jgi:thiol-disulfide isomerase/thioredoxin